MTTEPPYERQPALEITASHFAALCELAPIGIFQADLNGQITYLNPKWEVWTGRRCSESLGAAWLETVHPDDRQPLAAVWRDSVANRREMTTEFRVVRPDGGIAWLQMAMKPVASNDGPIAFTGTLENVTARHNGERFIGFAAHELRNPVAAIVMASEALLRLCAGAPGQAGMAEVISRQSQEANRLVDEFQDLALLFYGKLELRKQPVDLTELVRRAVSLRKPTSDRERIRCELAASELWLDGDAARLSQALDRLIDYAIKLAPQGSQLTLSTRLSPERRAIFELRAASDQSPLENPATIFEPFPPSAPRSGAKASLRLAFAKGLVELHSGSIVAETITTTNEICIRATLPLAERAVQPQSAGDRIQQAGRKLRILLIEDSADVVASLEFMLKASGHELHIASNAVDGVAAAQRLEPDVVLCDIGLPDNDGYSVAQAIRSNPATASLYLIAVSGYGSSDDQRRSLDAGFDMHLNKPEGFVGLSERLQQLPFARKNGQGTASDKR